MSPLTFPGGGTLRTVSGKLGHVTNGIFHQHWPPLPQFPLLASFRPTFANLDDWPGSYGTVSATEGRGRIACDTGYSGLQTARVYTFTASSVTAAIYPAAAEGAGQATSGLSINSTADGTSISAVIDTAAGIVKLSVESGYYDPNSLNIPYNPTTMRYLRLQESVGQVSWHTSPNGATWTQHRATATPGWVGTDFVTLQFSAHRDAGTANYAEIASINS